MTTRWPGPRSPGRSWSRWPPREEYEEPAPLEDVEEEDDTDEDVRPEDQY